MKRKANKEQIRKIIERVVLQELETMEPFATVKVERPREGVDVVKSRRGTVELVVDHEDGYITIELTPVQAKELFSTVLKAFK